MPFSMQRVKLSHVKPLYSDIVAYVIVVILGIFSVVIHFGLLDIEASMNILAVASWFNIYFLNLALFILTRIYFKQGSMLTYPNKFLLFPLSRFDLFKMEFRSLVTNISIILISVLFFYIVVRFNYNNGNRFLVVRLFVDFLIQYLLFNWLFLLFKNIFQPHTHILLSIFLLVQILNSMATIFRQPIFLLNPVFGWILLPEIFEFNDTSYIIFIALSVVILFAVFRITLKVVKWLI